MTDAAGSGPDWGALWRAGVLPRLCFISLGIMFHAGAENMMSTIMPVIVRDIGGVELNGWSFAIYEIGSIVAGAATGRMCTYWTVRTNMVIAAMIYAAGATATALSPSMEAALVGRLVCGFGGGALIALSYVAVQRSFPSEIWPQLLSVLAVVWGVAAFAGPLYGGLVGTTISWRWAFGFLAIAAAIYAVSTLVVLRDEVAPEPAISPGRFPLFALACLAAGITAIAAAGVEAQPTRAVALVVAGVAGIVVFFAIDRHNQASRLFPSALFDPGSVVGSGHIMVAALAIATCSFGFYGPLLLSALHGFSPVTTGLIIASESIAWSILSIVVANSPKQRERLIVRCGALMVSAGIAGFAWTVPTGSIPGIVLFASLQGGGFGILWPFASRRVIEAAPASEKEVAASGFGTLQRIGYAVGGAIAGIIANSYGFSGGFTREAAATAVLPLFVAFLPVAAVGCYAAFRMTSADPSPAIVSRESSSGS